MAKTGSRSGEGPKAGARRRRNPGRPAIPPEVQRSRLMEAALRAFRDGSVEHVTVSDIVREAGMSTRSFYEHFASKEDLVVRLVDGAGSALLRDMEAVFEGTHDPRERLQRGLRAFLDAYSRTPVDVDRLGETAPLRVMQTRRRYLYPIAGLVAEAIADAHRRGLVARPPDPIAVEVVLAGVDALASRYVAEGRVDELPELHAVLAELLARAWF